MFALGVLAVRLTPPHATTYPLWPGDADAARPTLTVFRPAPARACRSAVIVCPGGGYSKTSLHEEGTLVAEWLRDLGLLACVLDYRHSGRGFRFPAPFDDGRRAIRTVRAKAAEWDIDPDRIGILGFSAGGHVASLTGTLFQPGDATATDPIERVSSRPDFMLLAYPVILMGDPSSSRPTQENLLGSAPSPDLVARASSEKHVTSKTPPTFLFHRADDTTILPENSLRFYLALRRAGVPAELHIHQEGGHGGGLVPDFPGVATFKLECESWMRMLGVFGPR